MLFARSTQRRLAYPVGALIDLASFVAIFGLTLLLWRAVVSQGNSLPMAWSELLRYLCVAFGLGYALEFGIYPFQQSIRTGGIAIDLLRPVPVTWLHLCNCLSWGALQAVYVAIAAGLLWHWIPDLRVVTDLPTVLALLVSLCLAALLQFSIFFLFAQGSFITQFGYGILYTRLSLHQVFSGAFAPVALFPESLKPWALALPFRHVIDTPARIALGMTAPGEIPILLAQQAAWGLGLFLLGQLIFDHFLGKAQIQGG